MRYRKDCRNWWDCRTERQRSLLRYFGPLVLFLVLVAVDWLRFHIEGRASQPETRQLFIRVGLGAYLACAAILISTRRWSLQVLGTAAVFFAGGELKYRLLAKEGPQPVAEWERDMTQAFFEIGTLAVIVSVLVYLLFRAVTFLTANRRVPRFFRYVSRIHRR